MKLRSLARCQAEGGPSEVARLDVPFVGECMRDPICRVTRDEIWLFIRGSLNDIQALYCDRQFMHDSTFASL